MFRSAHVRGFRRAAALARSRARRRSRLFGPIPGVLAAVLAGLLTACATAPVALPDTATPGWTVRQGQALWCARREAPELAGELVLATHANGDFVLHFQKTPLPICSAHRVNDRWQVEFPTEGRRWVGRGRGNPRLLWLHLPGVMAGKPVAAPLGFAAERDGRWRLENRRTGEWIEGFLSP